MVLDNVNPSQLQNIFCALCNELTEKQTISFVLLRPCQCIGFVMRWSFFHTLYLFLYSRILQLLLLSVFKIHWSWSFCFGSFAHIYYYNICFAALNCTFVCALFLFLKMTPNSYGRSISLLLAIFNLYFTTLFAIDILHACFISIVARRTVWMGFALGTIIFRSIKWLLRMSMDADIHIKDGLHRTLYTPLNSHHSKPHSTDKIPPMRRKTQQNCIQLVFCRSFRYE